MFLRTLTLIFGMTVSGSVALLMFSGCSQPAAVLLPQDTVSEMGRKDSPQVTKSVAAPVREAPRRPTWEAELSPVTPVAQEEILVPLVSELPPIVTAGQVYTVKKGDSLWAISQRYGITVPTLAQANELSKDAALKIGQTLVIPESDHAKVGVHSISSSQSEPLNLDEAMTTYTVRQGDTLSKIAQRNGIKVAAIKSLNHLNSDTIRVGQKLFLPTASYVPVKVGTVDNTMHAVLPSGDTYQVQSGDTLSGIAARAGCKTSDLMALNGIEDARSLRAGQIIKLPVGAQEPSVSISHQPVSRELPVVEEVHADAAYEPTPVVPEGFGDDDALDLMDAAEVVPVE